jgi:hypothetical protein
VEAQEAEHLGDGGAAAVFAALLLEAGQARERVTVDQRVGETPRRLDAGRGVIGEMRSVNVRSVLRA